MASALPEGFLDQPFAHRGLHDKTARRTENSIAAIEAACDAGVGIELDLQLSADGVAMVFHDHVLERLTAEHGPVSARDVEALSQILLKDCGGAIPTLHQALELIAGRVPLVLEIKDQTGKMQGSDGRMELAVMDAVAGYAGPVAAMSFNPDHIACLLARGFDRPVGLVTGSFAGPNFNHIEDRRREMLARITPAFQLPISFLSHSRRELDDPGLRAARDAGLALLCWTTHTPEQAASARQIVDQVTFEGEIPR